MSKKHWIIAAVALVVIYFIWKRRGGSSGTVAGMNYTGADASPAGTSLDVTGDIQLA